MYSRKTKNNYLLWFVAQTGYFVIRYQSVWSTTQWIPGSIWMKPITWWITCWWFHDVSVPWPTKAAQIGTLYLKNFRLRFLGECSMKQIYVSQPVVPPQYCCLCCSLYCAKLIVPGREIVPSFCPEVELFTFTSQARPQSRFCRQTFAHPRRGAE